MRKWGGMRATLGVFVAAGVGMSEQMIWGEQQVAAAESPAQQPSPFGALDFTSRKEPIHIRSHDLEFFYNQKRIIYRGAVVATQGDSTLKSSTLTVTYEDTAPAPTAQRGGDAVTQGVGLVPSAPAAQGGGTANTSKGQKIKEIIAEENVEITSTTRRATCNKAVFSDTARTITLTGNAILRDEANEVTGQKVTIYVDEGRTTVEGDPKMVLTPKQEDKGKKGEGAGE
jgi:lipopolysaccharide export system protein LptA